MYSMRCAAVYKVRNIDDVPTEFFLTIFQIGTSAKDFIAHVCEGRKLPVCLDVQMGM
jgi:hypothetical protein